MKSHGRRPIGAIVLVTVVTGGFVTIGAASTQRSAAGRLRPGDAELTLRHDDRRRSYLVRVPPQAAGGRPLPVLIAFHGGGGNAAGFKRDYGFDPLADRDGFIVLYPNGTGPLRQTLLTFNAGNNCCGSAHDQNVDDVGFAVAALEDLSRRTWIDRSRVYATGHSNGGIMAYRLAAERAEVIAAVASVAGAMSLDRFAPSRRVPVLHIHSVDDPRALYAGGTGPPFPGTERRVDHAAVDSALAAWIRHNGCGAEARSVERRPPDRNGHTAERLNWAPCADGAAVEHWRLTGAGHGWPGGRTRTPERLVGPHTSIIDASEEIWRFLSRYQLPPTSPRASASCQFGERSGSDCRLRNDVGLAGINPLMTGRPPGPPDVVPARVSVS